MSFASVARSSSEIVKVAATLTLSEDDLVALVKGGAQPKDLYMRGALRVDGDVRLAHKLGFLNQLG